jgi:hypothetical protein
MKTYLSTILFSFLAVIAPIKPLILLAFGAIILDTYFGLWKTVRLKGWKAIRSRRLSDTITKSFLYVGGILLIFFAELYILQDITSKYTSIDNFLTKTFTIFCLVVEAKSINESYYEVKGVNLWKSMIVFIQRARETSNKIKDGTEKY